MEDPVRPTATTIERSELSFGAPSRASSKRTRRIVILRIAVLAALIVGLTVAGYALGWFDLARVARTIARLQSGKNALTVGLIFFLIYAALTGIGFPALPFTVAGGAIFGHVRGTLLSWAAAILGTILGYLLARGVGRETARRWIAKRKVGAALTQSTSFLTLLRLRLVPVIPLSVVNFASGLARTRFGVYVAATAIGILPATIVFTYFADSLMRGLQGARAHAYWDVAIASTVLMAMSLLPVLAKRYWRA
jgi:uncharacterized membrane protein YdjX (TVP38/TMEM64 family)